MTYKKVEVDVYEDKFVFAGACGDYASSSCGSAVHRSGASGACGDYAQSSCGSAVHRRGASGACGDYAQSSCDSKVHRS